MGNTNKNVNTKEIQISINHPFFKQAKLITNQKQRFLVASYGLDQKNFNAWELTLLKFNKEYKKLLLPLKKSFNRKGMCGNTGLAEVYYPNYSYQLSQEIYNRCGHKSLFKQTQIWHLLLDLIIAFRQSYDLSQPIDDVRPKNLFLNQLGQLKVPVISTFPHLQNKYHKKIEGEEPFFAPQQLTCINNKTQHQINIQKATIFCIGLTLLCLTNRTQYQNLYDHRKNHFYIDRFNDALQTLKINKYSLILKSVILNLLSLDPNDRMDLKQLQNLLLPHQFQINQYKNFIIKNAPEKLDNNARQLQKQLATNNTQTSIPLIHKNIGEGQLKYPQHLQVQKVVPQYIVKQQINETSTQKKSQTVVQVQK